MTPHIRNLCIVLLVSAMMATPLSADRNQTRASLQMTRLNILEMSADPQGRCQVGDRMGDRVLHIHTLHIHADGRHDTNVVMRRTADGWMVVDSLSGQGPRRDKALSGAR